jgi:3-hydroxy acid dehydrogenase / malonic semialdehyde reductase
MLRRSIFGVSGFVGLVVATTASSSSCAPPGSAITASNKVSRPAPAIKDASLKNRTVLITGATAGIGLACAWRFAEAGANLVLVGRREERLSAIKKMLAEDFPAVRVHTVAMSVADTAAVARLPAELPMDVREVDVLVNNAGLALGVTGVADNSVADAATVLETNVLGTVAFCSAFLPGMVKRNRGHVINVGSVAGHHAYASGSVYNASKYAVHGFTSAARHDLGATPVRVTHISPGLVGNTEFSNVRLKDDGRAQSVYADLVALAPEDVADNVIYAATRPPHVQIADIIMYSTNQSGPRDTYRVGPSLGAK